MTLTHLKGVFIPKYLVRVKFNGVIEVIVPESLIIPPEVLEKMAKAKALAQVVAVVENPDAPEEEALDQACSDVTLTKQQRQAASKIWDKTNVSAGVSGAWEESNE
jgi:hypothetical protein